MIFDDAKGTMAVRRDTAVTRVRPRLTPTRGLANRRKSAEDRRAIESATRPDCLVTLPRPTGASVMRPTPMVDVGGGNVFGKAFDGKWA